MIRLACPSCGAKFQARYATTRPAGAPKCCSRSCARKQMWKAMPVVQREAVSKKMSESSTGRPSWNSGRPWPAAHRARLSRQAKLEGRTIKIRGGNGTGMAPCEKLVAEVLPPGWRWNFAVPLGPRRSGYPTCYKLDFALPEKKIGLEVDGPSHRNPSRRAQDWRKVLRLGQYGWRVFRISNEKVRSSTTSELRAALTSLLAGC